MIKKLKITIIIVSAILLISVGLGVIYFINNSSSNEPIIAVDTYTEGFIKIKQGEKYGLMDKDGNIALP